MFTDFFYALRAGGLKVSLDEWLMLTEALDKGLCRGSFSRFYLLCRAVLVKHEADYARFDALFSDYFKSVACAREEDIPPELLAWLNAPAESFDNYDAATDEKNASLSREEIQEMLARRLREQDEEHNGGRYWVGTGGMSLFGNAGNSSTGIRVGGQSLYRRAFQVGEERTFEDFREDVVLGVRQFQTALRRLRQFSTRLDLPRDELDLDGTVRATGDNAGRLTLRWARPRKNAVKLLLLMDSGGSMDPYRALCAALFQAASASSHFKDLKIYYFHNCPYSKLYKTPECKRGDWVETQRVLHTLDGGYKLLILGDALMDPSELTGAQYFGYKAVDDSAPGLTWLRRLHARFKRAVWLRPSPYEPGEQFYWRQSYELIEQEFPMYSLTLRDLEAAFRYLLSSR